MGYAIRIFNFLLFVCLKSIRYLFFLKLQKSNTTYEKKTKMKPKETILQAVKRSKNNNQYLKSLLF